MENNNLLDYLPGYVQDYREIREIALVEQGEFDDLWVEKDQILDNAFIMDADDYGVSRYETILGIVKKPSETLDERKFNILVKVNEQLPYTMNALKEKLKNLCGADGYRVILTHTTYTLEIKVALVAKNNFDAVTEMVKRVVPCNLVCVISIIYNTNAVLHGFTHGELADYTQYELRNEVFTHGN